MQPKDRFQIRSVTMYQVVDTEVISPIDGKPIIWGPYDNEKEAIKKKREFEALYPVN